MNVIPVWQMVLEAATASDNEVISYHEIKRYIKGKYGNVNESTINCQIIVCCVNHPSRIHYFENLKPRVANGQYDFLFRVGRGEVLMYNPEVHGQWEIALGNEGLIVRQTEGDAINKIALNYTSTHAPNRNSTRKKVARPDIQHPSPEQVSLYLNRWDTLENYTAQESALNKLFWEFAPLNISLEDILLKVVTLNTFYSTNLKSVYTAARHIFDLGVDERLKSGDETLVDDIAHVTMSGGKVRHEYASSLSWFMKKRQKLMEQELIKMII